MNNNWRIRKLNKDDDLYLVAELIMETDPYIYKDLFGDLDNAKKVLPYLFERDSGIFKRSCYYLALDGEEVLGIIAFFKCGDNWDTDEVQSAFIEAGVALPESFDAVNEYFKQAHNYLPEVKACNVCVRKEHRNKGVGDFMVKEVIKLAGNSNITLSVLKDNVAAVKLYKNNGFKKLYEYKDYGGYGKPKVACYSMIKLRPANNFQGP